MLEQGFGQFLSTNDDVAGGQFVITPRQAVPYNIAQDVQSMLVPAPHRTWQSSIPIRLMNRELHAGFYSSGWGLLPFSISRAPVEEITVQQVSYLVEKLPEIILENTAKQEIMIPRPASGGGVELVVPAPGRIRIPYDGPSPVRVEFSCRNDQNTRQCPMHVYYDRNGFQAPLALHTGPSAAGAEASDISLSFELDSSPGVIILDIGGFEGPDAAHSAVIKNWLMLPLGASS
jgi:hypothetical protein